MGPVNRRKLGLLFVISALALLLILIFMKSDIDREQVFLCEAVASNPDLDMEDCPAHNNNISWLLVVAFGIVFLFLGFGTYMIFAPMKKEEKEITPQAVDTSNLSEEEKRICDLLKQNSGSMYQSDLIKETGYSKVQMTRALDKLEGRKIIDRRRRGMTNIVILR